jgi:DNA-binding transcriptional LysR family regulator
MGALNKSDFDWNDLRYVLAITRAGSAAAAAKALDVSHATVLRRIQALEKQQGELLFQRTSNGYMPTAAAWVMAELAMAIENSLGAVQEARDEDQLQLAGRIRFTTTDSLAIFLLPPLLAEFSVLYPQIMLELIVTNDLLDLERLDADVSLRICSEPPGHWVGRQLSRVDAGVYASAAYCEQKAGLNLEQMQWILPAGPLANARPCLWLRRELAAAQGVLEADSFIVMEKLASCGLGTAVLPQFVAAAGSGLQLLQVLPRSYSNNLWLLSLPATKSLPRIRCFTQFLVTALENCRSQLQTPE